MAILKKIFGILLSFVVSPKGYKSINDKFARIKLVFQGDPNLRFVGKIGKILLFPISFCLSLVFAIFKSVLILVIPRKIYFDSIFVFNNFYEDVSKRHLSFKMALKRAKLIVELLTKGAEKKVSFGEKNPDKTFFVIRPYYYMEQNELVFATSSLLFHYYRNLQHLSYGIEQGWIPIVDWENYGPFSHGEDYPINGTKNCWEYFWKQPSEYTLEEVYQSKNVILSDQNTRNYGFIPNTAFQRPLNKYADMLAHRCPKYDKLVALNQPTREYIDAHEHSLFPEGSRILGVSIRAMSYGTDGRYELKDHPIQPEINDLIRTIKKTMEDWEMDYVFFACEGEHATQAMRDAFGEKLLVIHRKRYEKHPTDDFNPLYVPGQRYQTNLDYLTEMVLLSRCNSLLASMSSGVRAAIIWNANRYEHMSIIDNGLF